MSDTETQRVTCPSCDKGYRWDAKLIGKTVSCKGCGAHFEVPDRPGIAGRHLDPVVADDGTYDLNLDEGQRHPDAPEPIAVPANDGKCPSCNNKIKETAVICLNCGFNLKAGQKIQTTILDEPDTPATTQPRLPQTSAADSPMNLHRPSPVAGQSGRVGRRSRTPSPVLGLQTACDLACDRGRYHAAQFDIYPVLPNNTHGLQWDELEQV